MELESVSKSVTDDHYTSFSDPDAQERLYAAQLAIRPNERINEEDVEIVVQDDGQTTINVRPLYGRERVGMVGSILLPPGATVTIRCPHGVIGDYRTRECREDGSLRRKTK